MHVELLVEERSAEVAIRLLFPRIAGKQTTFAIHPFHGKDDLLAKLPSRLRAYREWVPEDWRIIVLIDEDREDCLALKRTMEAAALGAGFATRSSAGTGGHFVVLNRLAVEELEAWFFGDVAAIATAYPRIPTTLDRQARYRDPDTIRGGTWEALEQVLQASGYHKGGLPKVAAARAIAAHMDPDSNRSRSFCLFRDSLREIVW